MKRNSDTLWFLLLTVSLPLSPSKPSVFILLCSWSGAESVLVSKSMCLSLGREPMRTAAQRPGSDHLPFGPSGSVKAYRQLNPSCGLMSIILTEGDKSNPFHST
jgi:hypothetical protein